MRTLIIDDEKHCREGLAIKLAKHCTDVEVVEMCANAKAGIKAIAGHEPDFIFLDIEMPGMNGFEMLEYCGGYDFEIIFTTAYNEYAIKAIRYSALDYLLKPVNKTELVEAVERVSKKIARGRTGKVNKLLDLLNNTKTTAGKIALPTMEGLLLIDVNEILYCESSNAYTKFFLAAEKTMVVSKTLKDVEVLLSDKGFFRVHHGFIINLNMVQKYIKGKGGEVVMQSGKSIPVSRAKRDEFLKLLERI